jgi:hypothetical protein
MSNGFAKIRNGLREHIKQGKLHPTDLGVYLYLHLSCDWSTGIYHGTAEGIAYGFSDSSLKNMIQKSLNRLRDKKYINYPRGTGKRKAYNILIDKFEPSGGARSGLRLNAWKHGDKCVPEYESGAVQATVEPLLSGGQATVERPIPYIKDLTDVPNEERHNSLINSCPSDSASHTENLKQDNLPDTSILSVPNVSPEAKTHPDSGGPLPTNEHVIVLMNLEALLGLEGSMEDLTPLLRYPADYLNEVVTWTESHPYWCNSLYGKTVTDFVRAFKADKSIADQFDRDRKRREKQINRDAAPALRVPETEPLMDDVNDEQPSFIIEED